LEASENHPFALGLLRIVSSRPETAAADSRVSVIVPARFAMNALSADVIVSVMFVPVRGAGGCKGGSEYLAGQNYMRPC